MRTRTQSVRFALALTLAVAALAACSDPASDGASGETTSTTAPAESTTTTEAYTSDTYADTASWLCHPDRSDDACDADLDATLIEADGTRTIEPFEADDDAPIDCFYVYPTVSEDLTPNSDLVPSNAEMTVVRDQVARLASTCRVFAPVYRQVTIAGLFGDESLRDFDLAYDDVLDAWRHYLANENDGRGVSLIGHSQGSYHLIDLLGEVIDDDDAVRERLVSAIITGGSIAVPEGEDVGGDFDNIPLCRAADEIGCVFTWSTYSDAYPPDETSLFGVVEPEEGRAACVNPAAPAGGSAPLDGYLSVQMLPGGGRIDPPLETPYVHLVGLVEAECVEEGRYHFLKATPTPEPGDARPADLGGNPLPGWGVHLHDLALPQGDLLEILAAQAASYQG